MGVAYQSDLDKVERATVEVAREVHHETEGWVSEFELFIRYNNFGDSGIISQSSFAQKCMPIST